MEGEPRRAQATEAPRRRCLNLQRPAIQQTSRMASNDIESQLRAEVLRKDPEIEMPWTLIRLRT